MPSTNCIMFLQSIYRYGKYVLKINNLRNENVIFCPKILSKYDHNHTLQAKPRHCVEDPENNNNHITAQYLEDINMTIFSALYTDVSDFFGQSVRCGT